MLDLLGHYTPYNVMYPDLIRVRTCLSCSQKCVVSRSDADPSEVQVVGHSKAVSDVVAVVLRGTQAFSAVRLCRWGRAVRGCAQTLIGVCEPADSEQEVK
jgi:hypothetical protein